MQSPFIDRADSVLVFIDLQEKLLPVISGREEIIANAARLAEFAGIIGLSVAVTEQMKLGPTVEQVKGKLGQAPVLEKISFDCFGCQGFADLMDRLGKGTMLLCGVESHICVAQTALRGLAGHRVQIVADAVGSRNPANREVALTRLDAAGAEITSTEMLIYELLGKAGTEEFKATLPLVK